MTKLESVFEPARPNFQRERRRGIGWALPKSFGPMPRMPHLRSGARFVEPCGFKSRMEISRHLDSFTVWNKFLVLVAERAGFEPAVQLPAHTLSKRAL